MAAESNQNRGVISRRSSEVMDANSAVKNVAATSARQGDDVLLQRTPFAVLLPTLGDTAQIIQMKTMLKSRHDVLKSDNDQSLATSDGVLGAEAAMLTQVLQWLDEL